MQISDELQEAIDGVCAMTETEFHVACDITNRPYSSVSGVIPPAPRNRDGHLLTTH